MSARLWFDKIRVDEDDYIKASPGFLMGMLNAASTIVGLVAICGIDIERTITRCLRSSDDSMTVFVASSVESLCSLITLTYGVYRLFGINPSKEKTILFPEFFGEYTSWYQDKDFVGQYGVETSSLKPMGKNPQDDFNSVASKTLQLMRTHIINVFGAITRLCIGVDNVRKLWNVKNVRGIDSKNRLSPEVIFLADGGANPWTIENLASDESTLRYNNIANDLDKKYFMKVMNPGNPFSEPAEEQLLYSRDVGVMVSTENNTPRNVFCRRSNKTSKDSLSQNEAKREKANQEAFEIATSADPSFLLTIPCSKAPLNKYLSSTLILLKERVKSRLGPNQMAMIDNAIVRLETSTKEYIEDDIFEEDGYELL